MRQVALSLVLACAGTVASAHYPNKQADPVYPRIDVIGPLGNNLPPSYRRKYNRPTKLGGKIAYWIAPSSQEAMAWHAAMHSGAYQLPHRRSEAYYFHAKPWEEIPVGPRVPAPAEVIKDEPGPDEDLALLDGPEPMPVIVTPIEGTANQSDEQGGAIVGTRDLPDPSSVWLAQSAVETADGLVGTPHLKKKDIAQARMKGTSPLSLEPEAVSEQAAVATPQDNSAAEELRQLRAENRRLKMERDLLKKATGLFDENGD